jgi:hypothetical protein
VTSFVLLRNLSCCCGTIAPPQNYHAVTELSWRYGTPDPARSKFGIPDAYPRRTVLIDFLSTTTDRRRHDLFSPLADAIAIAFRHSRRVAFDHSDMLFKFMLHIRLDDSFVPSKLFFFVPF